MSSLNENQKDLKTRYCAVVPAYREGGRIGKVVEGIRRYCPNVIVVDDGSPDETVKEAESAGAFVLRHEVNRGKGEAHRTGFEYAHRQGYDFVITLDADGQHAPEDIPAFVDEYEKNRTPVLVGTRMADPRTMPLVRRLTNRFMSWLISREMGQWVPDTQCGYRLYALDVLPLLNFQSAGFAAESEVLLNLADKGIKIGSVPIRIIYGDEKSKIRPVRDTMRFFAMLRKHRGQKKS
jgi:glycosyltransferase involved in cell wall biosynthesis